MLAGYVDLVGRGRIAGWAADLDAPNAVREVAVAVNGREVGRVKADLLRRDLQKLGRFGDGHHGFRFDFTPPLDPAGTYDVIVRFADADTVLRRGAFRIRPQCIGSVGNGDDVAEVDFYDPDAPPPPARPRYVIHVGLPKTGTKYLQSNFWNLRRELREQGVLYPSRWWQDSPIFAHHDLAQSLRQVPDVRIADIFAQLNGSGSPVVLLSSEGFNPVPESGLAYLRELTRGAQVEIVFYARRWSDWIPSQWQQAVKQGSQQTFPEWCATLLQAADRHPGINQALFLDKFAKVFGRENIRLVSYSNLMDRQVELFEHFCKRIIRLPDPPVASDRGSLVHESMDIFLTELIRGLNAEEALRGRIPGYHVFHRYERLKAEPDVADDAKLLVAAMERHVGELTIDDNAGLFDHSYNRLSEYSELLVSPEYGADVFHRQARRCRYARPDYLLETGAGQAVSRLAHAMSLRLDQGKAASAP